ncbi:MAG: phytoene synthase, partial [Rubellimicrobium sp.]|nr:phytoene synthase [Rubellimicrobium sp.]
RPEAVAALARAGLEALAGARGRVPAAAVPVLRAHWQAGVVLRQAARDPGRVGAGRLGTSEFRRRAGLMLRVATGRW